MKYGRIFLVVALVLAWTAAAWAQEAGSGSAGGSPAQGEPAKAQAQPGPEEKPAEPGEPKAEDTPAEKTEASAEDDLFSHLEGVVEVRGQALTNTDQAGKFLEYRDEPTGVLSDYLALRTKPKADDEYWFELRAEDVAQDDGWVGWTFGKVGDWKTTFEYSRIIHRYGFGGKTIFGGVGSNELKLSDQIQTDLQGTAANLVTRANTLRNFTASSSDLDDELEQIRDRLKLRFEYVAIENITLYTELRYEDKDGVRPIGAVFASPGGLTTELPMPVDSYTLEGEIGAIYREGAFDAVVSYAFSRYDSRYRSMTWDNLLRVTDQLGGAGAAVGRLTLDPDNWAHTASLKAGYNLPWWQTRVTGEMSASWRTTDDQLEPYTTNSLVVTGAGGAPFNAFDPDNLPVSEFDGEVNVQYYSINATSRPTRELDLRLKGSHRRQNDDSEKWKSPGYVRADGAWTVDQQENERLQYAKTSGSLDAGYDVDWIDTRFTAGFQYDRWDRDHRDVDYSDERTYRAAAETTWTDTIKTKFGYSWAWRDRSSVDDPLPAELPFLRRADWSTRGRHKPTAAITWTPSDEWSVVTQYSYVDENYHVHFGLRDVTSHQIELDVNYAASEELNLGLFLAYSSYLADQRGRQWSPGGAGDPFLVEPGFPSASNWDSIETSDTYTVGLNSHWAFVPDRWTLDLSYVFAKNRSDIDLESPLGTAAANDQNFRIPRDLNDAENSQRHTITSEIGFTPSQRFRIAFGYEFDAFRLDNYYDDGLNPVPINPAGAFLNAYFLNNRFEDAFVHLFYLSGSYEF